VVNTGDKAGLISHKPISGGQRRDRRQYTNYPNGTDTQRL
jgi:hypothetical protein